MLGSPVNTSWSQPQQMSPGIYEAVFENSMLQYNSGQYKIAAGLSNNLRSYSYNDSEAFLVISEAGQTEEESRLVNKSSGMLLNQLPYSIQKTG